MPSTLPTRPGIDSNGADSTRAGSRLVLIGESPEEHRFLREAGERMAELLGHPASVHVELDPLDLTPEQRRTALVPADEPAFRACLEVPADELPARVAEAEARLGISSLRRLWRSDLQFWRDGASEEEMARQALGYVAVFDALLEADPAIAGGYFEESGRLIKRLFRAVAVHHGRRALVSIGLPVPGRTALVDQERFAEFLPPLSAFAADPGRLEAARAHIAGVRSRDTGFARPRDLALTPRRFVNFARLVQRSRRASEPGAHNARPLMWARDWLSQRARTAVLRRVGDRPRERARAVLYPVHFANDAQVTIRGEAYGYQFGLIRQIAAALPYGYELWVKPHPATPGDLPVSEYLRLLRRLPNARLIHPGERADALLGLVEAVVTINSTVGYEALLQGVPVVTLGDSPYRGHGLTVDLTGPSGLHDGLAAALRAPAPAETDVERLVAWLIEVSHPMTLMGDDLSAVNARRYGEALVREFGLDAEPAARG